MGVEPSKIMLALLNVNLLITLIFIDNSFDVFP